MQSLAISSFIAAMNQPFLEEEAQARAKVDGRVAFGLAAFGFAVLLLILLDRVGAPARLIASLGPLAAICGLVAVGVATRSMRVSSFYASGRGFPAPYAGLALAALAIGLFTPFLPPNHKAAGSFDALAGIGAGVALAALVTGPLLRKTGAFSIADLLAARFPELALRLGVVAVVCVASFFVAAAAFETAVRGLQTALLLDRRGAVALAGAAIVLIAVPGGLSGAVWSSFAAGCAALTGLALPLAALIVGGKRLPAPVLGDSAAWTQALGRLADWNVDSASGPHPMRIAALAIGVAALAPLLAPAIAARNRRSAHSAGRSALAWILLAAALVAISLAASALALDAGLIGQRPDQLPDLAYQASSHDLLTVCGKPVDSPASALAACRAEPGFSGTLRARDLAAQGAFLMAAAPELDNLGEAYAGLAAAGAICVALALAASAFHALATAVGHDVIYRTRGTSALTSRRLAITRALLLASVISVGAALLNHTVDAREMIALAAAFSSAAITPLLVLTFWPRATGIDALFALLCGLGAAELFMVLGGGPPSLGLLAAGSMVACAAAVIAGFLTSLFRPADPLRGGGVFFDRVVHGYGDVLNPDKGA